MSTSLGFSEISDIKKYNSKTRKNRKKLTRQALETKKFEPIEEENENDVEVNFTSSPKSKEQFNSNSHQVAQQTYQNSNIEAFSKPESPQNKPNYKGLYTQYTPYFNQLANQAQLQGSQKDALMEKLNYMIQLLEEQQDEKTEHVTEELILYLFLGVFVIFVVDSFTRAGKYVR